LSDILSNLGDTYIAHEGELVRAMLEELSHVELDDLLEVGMKKYEKRLLKFIVRNLLKELQYKNTHVQKYGDKIFLIRSRAAKKCRNEVRK
jgi:hypothetical protein